MRLSLNDAIKNQERREARANGQSTEFKNVPFFKLNDKSKAIIRFLFSDPSEIPVVRSHMTQLYSKSGKQYFSEVNCNGEGCALCEHKSQDVNNEDGSVSFAHDRMVLPLIVLERDGKKELSYELFVRPISFYTGTISPFVSRFGLDTPIEISRNGTKADTTYTMFPALNPEEYALDKTLEEIKADVNYEDTDISGRYDSIIKTWTNDQMEFYLNTKTLPTKANMNGSSKQEEVQQVTRRSANRHAF